MVRGILETALYVDDMQRSVNFYERVLGFPILDAFDRLTALRVAPHQVLLIFLKGASAKATVTPFGTIPPTDGSGHLHLAFAIPVVTLNEWEDRLRQNGVTVESALKWPEGGHSLYFRDLDGHAIELKTSDWDGQLLVE